MDKRTYRGDGMLTHINNVPVNSPQHPNESQELDELAKYWYHAGNWHIAHCSFIDYDEGMCNCAYTANKQIIENLLRKRELEGIIIGAKWALVDYNMPDTDTKANLAGWIADLTQQLKDLEKGD